MLGYKIAVGFDREIGPFPVIITLEIPNDALVICPIQGALLSPNIGRESIKKYRTDMAKILKIFPIIPIKDLNWNGKAYSLFNLYNFTWIENGEDSLVLGNGRLVLGQQFSYEVNEELVCNLNKDTEVACAEGIHFFATKYDTMLYYNHDNSLWAQHILEKLKMYWLYYWKDIRVLAE